MPLGVPVGWQRLPKGWKARQRHHASDAPGRISALSLRRRRFCDNLKQDSSLQKFTVISTHSRRGARTHPPHAHHQSVPIGRCAAVQHNARAQHELHSSRRNGRHGALRRARLSQKPLKSIRDRGFATKRLRILRDRASVMVWYISLSAPQPVSHALSTTPSPLRRTAQFATMPRRHAESRTVPYFCFFAMCSQAK